MHFRISLYKNSRGGKFMLVFCVETDNPAMPDYKTMGGAKL